MLLAVEVGNSNTLFGLYGHEDDQLLRSWRLSTNRDRMGDDWLALLAALFTADGRALSEIDAVILSSVVPGITRSIVEMAQGRLGVEPLIVDADLDLGLRILTDNPREVGADRLVDSVAAFARYGGPAIVVDLGTATTFDVISADGDYIGGAIAAGLTTSLRALTAGAAQLFTVELTLPTRAIATNTIDHLRSGIVLGHLAMLEGMIARIRRQLGVDAPVVLTGGLAAIFAGASPLIAHHDPDLTLDGLQIIHRRLHPGAA